MRATTHLEWHDCRHVHSRKQAVSTVIARVPAGHVDDLPVAEVGDDLAELLHLVAATWTRKKDEKRLHSETCGETI